MMAHSIHLDYFQLNLSSENFNTFFSRAPLAYFIIFKVLVPMPKNSYQSNTICYRNEHSVLTLSCDTYLSPKKKDKKALSHRPRKLKSFRLRRWSSINVIIRKVSLATRNKNYCINLSAHQQIKEEINN